MKPKKVPMRRCVACREMKQKRELVRIVKSPENEIFINTAERTDVGLYMQGLSCFAKALRQRHLTGNFKMEVPMIYMKRFQSKWRKCDR